MVSVAERLLRTFCAESINAKYDRMSSTDQETLRQAIITTVQQRSFSYIQQQNDQQSSPSTNSSSNVPLAIMLREIMPRLPAITVGLISCIEDLLSRWGAISSSISQYQQIVQMQRCQYDVTNRVHGTTTSSVVAKHTSDTITWNNQLDKIGFSDLVLFQTAKGCYIEGKIVGEPIQPMVGGTTLIQENSTHTILLICFYNLLPDGIHGAAAEPLLKAEFPMGSTIRVAEPYYKIFGDGQSGIRVDTPSEILVVDTNQQSISAKVAKQRGNEFVRKKQYLAAIDLYLKGLQTSSESDFVATVLSNRSQASIQFEDWIPALCDAAASLTIRPKSTKTWKRYQKCLQHVQDDVNSTKKSDILSSIVRNISASLKVSTTPILEMVDMKDMKVAHYFKQQGNEAFQKQSFQQAINFYTKCLDNSASITQAILNNWALCALNILNFGDAVASAMASLRIGSNEKATFRLIKALSFLGEYNVAQQLFDWIDDSSAKSSDLMGFKYQLDRCIKYRSIMIMGKADNPIDAHDLFHNTPPCLGNWIHECVETFSIEGKGRGIRATRDLAEGSVVMVEWPLISKAVNGDSLKNLVTSSHANSRMHMGSAAELRSISVYRLRREAVLAKIMALMSDGEHTPALVPVSELLVSVEHYPILLPGHHEYCESLHQEITADRVDKILHINCHGISLSVDDVKCQTELYPTVSMMNHASEPNCASHKGTAEFLFFVITRKSIKAGEELTMKYQTDEVVKRKWGIDSDNN